MSTTINTNGQNAMVQAFAGLIGTGSLVVYSGTAPANAKAALSGNTALATFTVAGFGAPASGVATANAIASTTGSAAGTATFVRVLVAGTPEYQCNVGAGVTIDNPNITVGGTVNVVSFTLTAPDA